jgi:hypothetical protein
MLLAGDNKTSDKAEPNPTPGSHLYLFPAAARMQARLMLISKAAKHLTRLHEEANSPWPPITIAAERLTSKRHGRTHDSSRAACSGVSEAAALLNPEPKIADG